MKESTSATTVAKMKTWTLWGLGALWLLDAMLQAQPRMFTLDFVSNIMKPSIAISPGFFTSIMTWTVNLVSPNIAEWNWFFMLSQFAIAGFLLLGLVWHKKALVTTGLIISIVWGASVWVLGEGTSGVFTGNGTILTGAPGSVFCYMLLAVFCLLPDRFWNLKARFCLPRDALSVVFFYGVVAQVFTFAFWTNAGIPSLIEGQASMAPSWLIPSMNPVVSLTSHDPAVWNGIFAAVMLAIGVLLFGRTPRLTGYVILGVALVVIWYWGQAFGGIFSGMGTDPNTPPLFAVMALPSLMAYRERVAARTLARSRTAVHAAGTAGLSK